MQVNIRRQVETSLRIASAVVFCIGSALIVPKVAHATAILSNLAGNSVKVTQSNSQVLNTIDLNTESRSDIYEPPNNGSPDSQQGTGTR